MIWNRIMALAFPDNPSSADKTVVSLAYKLDDEFISVLESAVQDAAEQAEYQLTVVDSKNSAALQLEQVKAAHSRGETAIIINLVDPDTAPDILMAAGDMKVVFLNRAPADMSILSKNAVYVGSDESVAGKLQGEWLVQHFREVGKGEIRYILLKGSPNLPSTQQRTDSALKALADGGIRAAEAAPPIIANYDRTEALLKAFPVLGSGITYDAIISNNDAMALGAIQALEYLNIDPSQTPIVGIDATEPAIQALKEGKLAMTVFQNAAAQGSVAVTALSNMLDGKPIPRGTEYSVSQDNPHVIWIPFEPVTRHQIPQSIDFSVITT